MKTSLKPITQAAIHSAQGADPNGRRCLVENCRPERAVQLSHVFEREASADSRQTGALEWSWNMRKNTLNLDTRGNIFFLGSSLHQMYKKQMWALLPEDDVVYRYYDELAIMTRPRHAFPVIENQTFRYKFIPLKDMDDIYITRQSDPHTDGQCVNTHAYPYDDFPTITSHVDPKFAILHLGFILGSDLETDVRRALTTRYPILQDVSTLYNRWIAYLPTGAEKNVSYIPRLPESRGDDGNDDGLGDELCSDGDTDNGRTPLRRIRSNRSEVMCDDDLVLSYTSFSSDDTAYAAVANQQAARKLKRVVSRGPTKYRGTKIEECTVTLLTRKALRRQSDELESEGNKWTPKKIKAWGNPPLILPPAPLLPPKRSTKKPGRPRRKRR